MIVADLIKIEENKFTYYFFFHNQITVNIFNGFPSLFLIHFNKIQNQLIVEMVQDFILIEKDLQHSSKSLHSFFQLIDNLKAFIKWAIENEDMAQKVNKFIVSKINNTLNQVVEMIPDEVNEKKDLLFIAHSVTKNSNHRINVYE